MVCAVCLSISLPNLCVNFMVVYVDINCTYQTVENNMVIQMSISHNSSYHHNNNFFVDSDDFLSSSRFNSQWDSDDESRIISWMNQKVFPYDLHTNGRSSLVRSLPLESIVEYTLFLLKFQLLTTHVMFLGMPRYLHVSLAKYFIIFI